MNLFLRAYKRKTNFIIYIPLLLISELSSVKNLDQVPFLSQSFIRAVFQQFLHYLYLKGGGGCAF